ncbi:MAG TPA: response regulator [bacterium]|nr:response regulator [bacterium]HPN43389.1 response regulator [bacterium]
MAARILVIDDEEEVREILKQMLELEGYQVITAGDGNQGLKLFRQNPTDLVITDIIMPEKEGIETIIELRNEFPNVKIISISGGGRISPTDYLTMSKKLGAVKSFTKPFERKKLLKAVEELLADNPKRE